MALVDSAYIKTLATWMTPIDTADFAAHIVLAEQILRDWVGDTNYDAAEADDTTKMGIKLKLAEAHIVIAKMLPQVNIVFGDNGIVLNTTKQEGDVTNLNPNQVKSLSMQFMSTAEAMARDYYTGTTPILKSTADEDADDQYL